MSEPIRFQNGAEYEEFMGGWSRLAGSKFLDWLTATGGAAWADVGCGNGAFTQLIVERCSPASVEGIDPSAGQIKFAQATPAARLARFQQGDSMALPYMSDSFDIAVMALVLFFVPIPAVGVKEMMRVVRPGGLVAAYTWDILGGGFPYDAVLEALAGHGIEPTVPPSAEASRMAASKVLWEEAGLSDIAATVVEVDRGFDSFEEYWRLAELAPGLSTKLAAAPADKVVMLKEDIRRRVQPTERGSFKVSARANAIKGRVPQ